MTIKPPLTNEQIYGPLMEITDQAQADAHFAALIAWRKANAKKLGNPFNRAKAERAERVSIAYYAGYSDAETRARVEKLFRCAHPIFGAIAEKGEPTPGEAFAAGVRLAKKMASDGSEVKP